MRPFPLLSIENHRVRTGSMASTRADGPNGAFLLPIRTAEGKAIYAFCISSNGAGWEHVSVSVEALGQVTRWVHPLNRCPTWEEMCQVKDLFWPDDEAVVQYHPRRSEYRNHHPYVLHLWRPTEVALPEPDADFVAPRPGESVGQFVERRRSAGAPV